MSTHNKIDRRVRKTESQLKQGLVILMQKKSIHEITVKELVEEVDINRSTFYLHYSDIYQMLDTFEEELSEEFKECLNSVPKDINTNEEIAKTFLLNLFLLFEKNRDLCRALLGPNGDPRFCEKIQNRIGETVQNQLNNIFPKEFTDVSFVHTFAMSGCFGLINDWLNRPDDSHKSPEHMANLTFNILAATFKASL